MKIKLDPKKSAQENAAMYYEKAKKIKAKIPGLETAIEQTKAQLEKERQRHAAKLEEKPEKRIERKKEWYENFHYFFTSRGKLVIGGKEAKQNQLVVKTHMEPQDLYLHADVTGASSMVMKQGQQASQDEKQEAATFAASFSRAWQNQRGAADVFFVKPGQVKTAAKAGEYLAKGAFVIRGDREYFSKTELRLAISYVGDKLVIAPENAIKKHTSAYLIITPGDGTKNDAAKLIFKKRKEMFPQAQFDIDWLLQLLPNGGSYIK